MRRVHLGVKHTITGSLELYKVHRRRCIGGQIRFKRHTRSIARHRKTHGSRLWTIGFSGQIENTKIQKKNSRAFFVWPDLRAIVIRSRVEIVARIRCSGANLNDNRLAWTRSLPPFCVRLSVLKYWVRRVCRVVLHRGCCVNADVRDQLLTNLGWSAGRERGCSFCVARIACPLHKPLSDKWRLWSRNT